MPRQSTGPAENGHIYSYYFCLVYSTYIVCFSYCYYFIFDGGYNCFLPPFPFLPSNTYFVHANEFIFIITTCSVSLNYIYILWSDYMELCNQLMCSSLGKTISLNLRILYLPVILSIGLTHPELSLIIFLRLDLHISKVEV